MSPADGAKGWNSHEDHCSRVSQGLPAVGSGVSMNPPLFMVQLAVREDRRA